MTDRHFRKWDIAYITAFLLLCGTVYTMAKHPMQWDENTEKIKAFEPRIDSAEKSITEIRSVQTTQMTLIIRELDSIHRELKVRREALRPQPIADDVAKG